ncbi:Retrovirus-related Pol polyprotein from transposon [Halotydeus destructor]|nr:Retrovirus-related Pol polyprotein from transposon [Halotydeus destructor]
MLESNMIEPSDSEWAFPAHLVRKKDGQWRFTVDYRKLNSQLKKDGYPLIKVIDNLNMLSEAVLYTLLDLFRGFWPIPIKKEHRKYTAFTTRAGLFQFKGAPMGIATIPQKFQRVINNIIGGLRFDGVLVYLDDVLVYGKNFEQMFLRLEAVFKLLRKYGLQLNPKKCTFAAREVEYLGFVVSKDGYRPDERKMDAVLRMPPPKNAKEVMSFLGTTGYFRAFIDGYADSAQALYKFTRKGVLYDWGPEQHKSFEQLKQSLVSAPVLKYFDPELPTVVYTGASKYAVGATLRQEHATREGPIEFVVAYHSRTLLVAEQNHCTTERECLAIVDAIKHFYPNLHMRKFVVVTDHCSLIYLNRCKLAPGRVLRWAVMLQDQDFEIRHRSGKSHCEADCLSCMPKLMTDLKVRDSLIAEPTFNEEIRVGRGQLNNDDGEVLNILEAQRDDPCCKYLAGLQRRSDASEEEEVTRNSFTVIGEKLYKNNGNDEYAWCPKNRLVSC